MDASPARFSSTSPSSCTGREVEALATTRQREAINWGTEQWSVLGIVQNGRGSPDGAIIS